MNISSQILASILIALSISACSASNDSNTSEKKEATIEIESEKAIITTTNFPYAFEQVANNTWVMHGPREFPNPDNKGFMNNPGIVETLAGLVVIDPGSTVHVGKNVLAEIKKVSDQKIVAIFNTHVHGDHWLANQAIKMAYPEVKIYGHPKMIDEINNGEGESWLKTMDTLTEGASLGTIVVAPDMATNNTDIIKIGHTQFKIHHFGIAHTKTDIMIEVIENSVVFLGDNVLSLRIPRTSDGTFQGNISSVKTMLESNAKTYVPGHGPTGDKAMVEEYINYLTLVYKAAQKTFEEDLDSSDVIKITKETTAAYKDWYGYEDLLGPQGAQAYSEVEAAEF
jgi:glyoxylase-like metal-dependent hydrolase (beta-lactamase superfamily II)